MGQMCHSLSIVLGYLDVKPQLFIDVYLYQDILNQVSSGFRSAELKG